MFEREARESFQFFMFLLLATLVFEREARESFHFFMFLLLATLKYKLNDQRYEFSQTTTTTTYSDGPSSLSGERYDVFANNPSICRCSDSPPYSWDCDCAGFTTKTIDGQGCELAYFYRAEVECVTTDIHDSAYSGCDQMNGWASTEGDDWLLVSVNNVFGSCDYNTRGEQFDLQVKITFETGSDCGELFMDCDENMDGVAHGRCRIPSGTFVYHSREYSITNTRDTHRYRWEP